MAFDPYHTWLGIRPDEQPPNHYRLLGLSLFEDSPAVIDNAADRQMSHVRTFQTGPHAAASQRLLSEITLARICLVNPQKRAAYDTELQKTLPPPPPQPPLAETQPIVVEVPPVFTPLNEPASTLAVRTADDAAGSIRRKKNPVVEVAKIVGGGLAGLVLSVLLLRYVALIDITGLLPVPKRQPPTVAQSDSTPPAVMADAKKSPVRSGGSEDDSTAGSPVASQALQSPTAVDTNPTTVNEPEGPAPGAGKKRKKGKQKTVETALSSAGAKISVAGAKPTAIGEDPAFPSALRGGTKFDWIDPPGQGRVDVGALEFHVEESGWVYLTADWNYQGNADGNWQAERLSKEQLIAKGWEPLGLCPWTDNRERPIEMLRKLCRQGESYRVRVNKYVPPLPFVPSTNLSIATSPRPQSTPSSPDASGTTPSMPPVRPTVLQRRRLLIPPAAEQEAVKKTLEDLYGLSKLKTEAEKLKVAGDLRGVARDAKEKPAEQFVAFRQAAELARDVGDAKLLAECIAALAQRFEFDLLQVEVTMLAECAKNARTAEAIESLVLAARPVVLFALSEGELELAKRLTDATMTACARPNGLKYRRTVNDGQKEINRQYSAWQAYQQALMKLAEQPDDTTANLTVGKWHCLERADWTRALPYLARAGHPDMQKAAELELAKSGDAAAQLAAADAWYAAGTSPPKEPLCLLRARMLYEQAKRGELDGLAAARVDRRLDELLKDDSLKPLVEGFDRAAARGRLRPDLSPIIRRHCVLAFTFEPSDSFYVSGNPMLRDLSGQENHGQVYGTSPVVGRAGSAFEFQTVEDFVESPDQPSLNPSVSFTVCAWILQHSAVHPGGADDIVSKEEFGGGTGRGFSLRLHDRCPDINFGSGPEWLTVRAPQTAETGRWMHLVGVYDGQHEVLVIDGAEVASMPCTKPMSVSPRPLRVGRGPFAQDRRFHGIIDEVAFFDTALTAEEIRLIHSLGNEGKTLAR